jgi:hypothetical protein
VSGFCPVVDLNRPVFAVQTRTAGGLPGPVANTTDKCVQFQVYLSKVDIKASTRSITDIDHVVNQLAREIDSTTSTVQMPLTKEFSMELVEFDGWSQGIGVQMLRKTIEQCVVYFLYADMHLLSHISKSIQPKGFGDT